MGFHPFAPEDVEAALGRRYRVGPEVAVGGQGVVFKATRTALPDGTPACDTVALKLNIYASQDIRVQREIGAMQSISHPALARIIEHGFCDVGFRYTRWVAYEFVEGEPLSQRLKNGRLLESEVLAIGRDVAAAIAAIWSKRIIHGDIKPSNILLKASGGAVLIDLGAARYLQQDNSPEACRPFGTLGYFSPEQIRGEKSLSCASDIFSLGVVMVQSLLGWHPTHCGQGELTEGLRASGSKVAASAAMLSILDKMLSKRPNFRPLPADLSAYFQRRLQKMEEDFALGARTTQWTGTDSQP